MDRRHFLALSAGTAAWPLSAFPQDAGRELSADVVIVGGGVGGCAAALGAVREGATVIMTEETDWVGGQLTSQMVPPDEHKYIETHGCTAEYRRLRNGVRQLYRTQKKPAMTADARRTVLLNPGNGWVSRVCAEPKAWLAVLEAMLAPHVASGKLRVLRDWTPVSADVNGDKVRAVTGRTADGNPQTLVGKYFLDATEQGDLLPLTKTEFVTGSESHKDTGEPSARGEARPGNIQSFTWVLALDHRPGEEHTIDKPAEYEFWKGYRPKYSKHKILSWEYSGVEADGTPKIWFDPTRDRPGKWANYWTYRRAVDAKLFEPGQGVRDISLINWGQNDYHLGPIHAAPEADVRRNLDRAKQQGLSMLYWLQTEAERPDGGVGWKGLALRPDVSGTPDGIAKRPYIRESRRIVPEFRVVEQMVSKPVREREHKGPGPARAVQFPDTVGVGLYLYIDIHATAGGDAGGGTGVLPFQIPLGALLPNRVENLLAACKNLGVTHITNGCYRLHTVEWNIGEAAGAAAGYCVAKGVSPKAVRADTTRLADLQRRLTAGGVELEWPADATN
jgi:hypothetical protein